jgi:hypothetical protein
MTIEVFFERGGYAEKVAEFYNDEMYNAVLPSLEAQCLEQGFTNVTESVHENAFE